MPQYAFDYPQNVPSGQNVGRIEFFKPKACRRYAIYAMLRTYGTLLDVVTQFFYRHFTPMG